MSLPGKIKVFDVPYKNDCRNIGVNYIPGVKVLQGITEDEVCETRENFINFHMEVSSK